MAGGPQSDAERLARPPVEAQVVLGVARGAVRLGEALGLSSRHHRVRQRGIHGPDLVTAEWVNDAGLRSSVCIGVGGAPLTHKYAAEIGADFYSEDAYECVQACNRLVESKRAETRQ